MTIMDPISDLFTRIRNAASAKHKQLIVPYSLIVFNILQLMKEYGFIQDVTIESKTLKLKSIKIFLKYRSNGLPIFSQLKRVSKLSRRHYIKKENIPKLKSGFGLSILTTSKGVLCGKQARLKNVGGELIGVIW